MRVDREHAAQALGLFVEKMKFRVAQRARQAVRRQYSPGHAVLTDGPSQLRHGSLNVLKREESHPFEPGVVPEKAIIEPVVVGARQIDREFPDPDLSDVHESGRIENGGFETAVIQSGLPVFQSRNEKFASAAEGLAMPAVMREQRKIEQRLAPLPVAFGKIFENLALRFAHMPVGVEHLPIIHCRRLHRLDPAVHLHHVAFSSD